MFWPVSTRDFVEMADQLLEELWDRVAQEGVNPSLHLCTPLKPKHIQNFSLDFKPMWYRLQDSRHREADNDARSMSYTNFLTRAGHQTTKNFHKDEIWRTPVTYPGRIEVAAP